MRVSIFTDYKLTAEYNYTISRPTYIITQFEVPTAYLRLRRNRSQNKIRIIKGTATIVLP